MSDENTSRAAVESAAKAYEKWKHMPVAKRMSFLYKIREYMARDLEILTQAITLDQAKHISEARGEVQRVIEMLKEHQISLVLLMQD